MILDTTLDQTIDEWHEYSDVSRERFLYECWCAVDNGLGVSQKIVSAEFRLRASDCLRRYWPRLRRGVIRTSIDVGGMLPVLPAGMRKKVEQMKQFGDLLATMAYDETLEG